MKSAWSVALAGALGGAVLSIAAIFAAAQSGLLPTSDARIRDYLLSHPQILADMTSRLQEQQEASDEDVRQRSVQKLGLKAYFNPRVAFVSGPENAKTSLVEFFDYNCPYCRASLPTVKKFIAAHKNDARIALIEFPIKGPESTIASRAAIAARRQPDKYLAFHYLLMGHNDLVTEDTLYADAQKAGLDVGKLKADMQDHSVDMAIAAAHTLAVATNIDGTPAFIVNGRIREGAIDDAALQKMLKASS